MTALALFGWISLAFILQAAIFAGIGFARHWQRYRQLQSGTAELSPVAESESVAAGWRGVRRFRVAQRVIENRDGSICSFHLVPEDGQPLPAFRPGQFLTFELTLPEGGRLVRCYSLSDAPQPDHYRVSIKRVPGGRSSNYFHDRVQVGSILDVRAPGGHFHLEPGGAPIVLIAGGIGITPMLSMIEWCLAHEPEREIWLFYGVRNGSELAMRERLESQSSQHASLRLHFCFSDPLPDEAVGRDYHHAGRVSLDLLRMQLPLKPYHFYICGPGAMMATMVEGLADWGVPEARIHYEAFGPASVKPRQKPAPLADADGEVTVTFARSGITVPWQRSAGSLLDFAEQAGVTVDSSCRGGACGTCRTTIRQGEVTYTQAPDYDPEPGTCLLCVCIPKTNVILEA